MERKRNSVRGWRGAPIDHEDHKAGTSGKKKERKKERKKRGINKEEEEEGGSQKKGK